MSATDLTKVSDATLTAMLTDLRRQKEEVQTQLRAAVTEYDRRATLADMQRRYGSKMVQTIIGAGGIASQESVPKPTGS